MILEILADVEPTTAAVYCCREMATGCNGERGVCYVFISLIIIVIVLDDVHIDGGYGGGGGYCGGGGDGDAGDDDDEMMMLIMVWWLRSRPLLTNSHHLFVSGFSI